MHGGDRTTAAGLGDDMKHFTVQLLRLGSGRNLLLCHFHPLHGDTFRAAVPANERTWHPRLHAWEITVAGYHALRHAERDHMADPSPEVLNHVYPWPE